MELKKTGKAQTIAVLAGEFDLKDDKATRHPVKAIYVHNKHGNQNPQLRLQYDFTILELQKPIDLSSGSRTPCLPKPEDTYFNEKTRFTVSGWGGSTDIYFDENNPVKPKYPDHLKYTNVEYCSSDWRRATYCHGCHANRPWEICTRSNRGTGACTGDSGGKILLDSLKDTL